MHARRLFVTAFALLALLMAAGCGGGAAPLGPETEDPTFIEGRQLRRADRNNEALNAFLKVIEKRGTRESPESHLEAGQLFLEHMKNPLFAYYHFQKYIELQPNSAEAQHVRALQRRAMRDFAVTVPGLSDQSVRVGINEEVDRLRRELDEARAELATLRGGGATQVRRPPQAGVQLPLDPRMRSNPVGGGAPAPGASSAPRGEDQLMLQPAPLPGPARPTTTSTAPAPQRGPVARPTSPPGAGRTHTVTVEEKSLWGIARKYYPNVNRTLVDGIFEANRTVMRSPDDLKAGMVLRIP